MGWEQMSCSL